MRASGRLGLRIAERTRTVLAKEARPLTEGTRFELGPYSLEVIEAGTLGWNGHASLTLECDRSLDEIASYRLITPDGRRVELVPRASYAADGSWRQTLEGEEPLESAALAIEFWEDSREIEVPFRLDAGLGLP